MIMWLHCPQSYWHKHKSAFLNETVELMIQWLTQNVCWWIRNHMQVTWIVTEWISVFKGIDRMNYSVIHFRAERFINIIYCSRTCFCSQAGIKNTSFAARVFLWFICIRWLCIMAFVFCRGLNWVSEWVVISCLLPQSCQSFFFWMFTLFAVFPCLNIFL